MAKVQGIIENFSGSPHSAMLNFPPTLLEPAQLASDIAFRCASGQGSEGYAGGMGWGWGEMEGAGGIPRAASLKDRFFVITLAQTEFGRGAGQGGVKSQNGLDPQKVQRWSSHALLPSNIAGERCDLVQLLQREGLHFHSLAHNNYSTMMLVHHLMEEQRMMANERRLQHPASARMSQDHGARERSGGAHLGHTQQHTHSPHAAAHHAAVHPYHNIHHRMDPREMARGMGEGHHIQGGYDGQWVRERGQHPGRAYADNYGVRHICTYTHTRIRAFIKERTDKRHADVCVHTLYRCTCTEPVGHPQGVLSIIRLVANILTALLPAWLQVAVLAAVLELP